MAICQLAIENHPKSQKQKFYAAKCKPDRAVLFINLWLRRQIKIIKKNYDNVCIYYNNNTIFCICTYEDGTQN